MNRLQALTRSWLDKSGDPKRKNLIVSREIESTRMAYDARRDPNVPSREYDFAFRSKPLVVPTLSVSDFDQLILAPGLVWLKKYLGGHGLVMDGNRMDYRRRSRRQGDRERDTFVARTDRPTACT